MPLPFFPLDTRLVSTLSYMTFMYMASCSSRGELEMITALGLASAKYSAKRLERRSAFLNRRHPAFVAALVLHPGEVGVVEVPNIATDLVEDLREVLRFPEHAIVSGVQVREVDYWNEPIEPIAQFKDLIQAAEDLLAATGSRPSLGVSLLLSHQATISPKRSAMFSKASRLLRFP